MVQWRSKLKRYITDFPLEESPIHKKGFRRLYEKASIELNTEIIKKLTSDLKIDQDYYYRCSLSRINDLNEKEIIESEEEMSPKQNDQGSKKDFSKGLNEVEKQVVNQAQKMLGDVPISCLDDPENYFHEGKIRKIYNKS